MYVRNNHLLIHILVFSQRAPATSIYETFVAVVCFTGLDLDKHRVFWEEPKKANTAGPVLSFDGVPFVINGSTVLDCQHGRRRGKRQAITSGDKASKYTLYTIMHFQ